jgi:hypothetical protein
MNTPETMQKRLQGFLQRFDTLADAVGPLDTPNGDTEQVAGLLLMSAEQCGVAAGIFDMAENIGYTLASKTNSHAMSGHNLGNPHRRGRMVVVPGFGDEDFHFPDVNTLVTRALARLGNSNDQEEQTADKPTQTSEEPAMLLILGATKLGEIMRMPGQVTPTAEVPPKTPTRDLLSGHSTAPQVCFLPDAETRVEPPVDEDGVLVVEFVIQSQGSLPDALVDAGGLFMGRAEQFLSAAESIWSDQKPPSGAAEAIPVEEKQLTACSS